MSPINYYIQMDERLNSLLLAIEEQDWERVESEGHWINTSQKDLSEVLTRSSENHPDEIRTIKKIIANFEKCQQLIATRLVDLNSLMGNNAMEMKLLKAYGG